MMNMIIGTSIYGLAVKTNGDEVEGLRALPPIKRALHIHLALDSVKQSVIVNGRSRSPRTSQTGVNNIAVTQTPAILAGSFTVREPRITWAAGARRA